MELYLISVKIIQNSIWY